MFLRKETKSFADGVQMVPFCNHCSSQNIKTVQVCKDCGSHDVKTDWQDERSTKVIYKDRECYIYKCDRCGKEFDGMQNDNVITFCEGNFEPFKYVDENGDSIHYNIEQDLCEDCKNEITNALNKQIDDLINYSYVENFINKYIKKGDK